MTKRAWLLNFCNNAQCLMTQTSRNLSTFNIASLMPFFRLITPFLYFYRWFLRQNDVYMQKVPWFFKLKFSAELCWGPGPAGCRTATRRQGHTHTPATTINGDYVAKININSQPKVCKDFPKQTVNNVNINAGGHHPPGFWTVIVRLLIIEHPHSHWYWLTVAN